MKLCVIDDSKPFLDVFINEIQVIGEELGLKMNIQAFDKYTPDIQSFDLYFIDIEMPDIDGFTAAKMICDINKKIVYTTGIEAHYIETFQNTVYDFVRKHHLHEDITRVIKRYVTESRNYIEVKVSGKRIRVLGSSIISITVSKNDILLKTAKMDIKIRMTLKELLKNRCIQQQFIQINRSQLINFSYVDIISKNTIVLKDQSKMYISRNYKNKCLELYYQYMMR
ncbi:MAG: LytTR family transcriptional regulator DNA-binding domain-containing protein [Erysipelotrichaceae bacterium]|nr:LytTR family transcriptional regulator DNA-binding domain-containing protein [Erysipelotrichaceae bacterium]